VDTTALAESEDASRAAASSAALPGAADAARIIEEWRRFFGTSADAVTETPAQNRQEDVDRSGAKSGENEAEAILDESKKDFKVTKRDLAGCLKDWDPQTQMSKAEWAESCRTTLEYFPDGQ